MAKRDPTAAYLKAFGAALRAMREECGLSQEGLGFEADVDRTYVSGVERGIRNPTIAVILRQARGLGVKPGDLVSQADRVARRR